MPTREQIKAKNLRAKKIRTTTKSIAKVVRNIVVATLSVVTVGTLSVFAMHAINTSTEKTMLSHAGLYKLVEVEEGRSINVSSYGNPEAKHTLVTISGLEVQDFTVFSQHITATLKDTLRVAFIDRAGYGYSDDSSDPQTVDQIISDYRTALTKAGIEGPYVLMAHEFGGVYATYWAIQYPDEIEGILYLDGTELLDSTEIKSVPTEIKDTAKSYLYKLGFHRIDYHEFYNHHSKALTQQESQCSKALNTHSVQTLAQLSEKALLEENFNKVMSVLTETEMPKLYLSVSNAFRSEKDVIKYFEYKNQQNEELGLPPYYELTDNTEQVSKDALEIIDAATKRYETNTKKFAGLLGNCHVARMPGDEKIYEQKPEGVTEALVDFLLYLDGSLWTLDDYYDDSKVINWENYKEEHQAESEGTEATVPEEEPEQ